MLYDVLPHKEVPFMLSPFREQIIKNHFRGVNMHFKPITRKILKLHIIETTASIPSKFCRTIKTRKSYMDYLMVFVIMHAWSKHACNKEKMADGRYFERAQQLLRWATVWP